MIRYKLIISYDGTFFHGFQRQKDYNSVQEDLENILTIVFKTRIIIHGAGRTDAGVHANGQVIHFDAEQIIPCKNLKKVINKNVYPHIYVKDVSYVDKTFHAQRKALGKEYYYLVNINEFDPLKANYMLFFHNRINIDNIRIAMSYIVGEHDFKSFAKGDKKNTVRNIYSFTLDECNGLLKFTIRGNGFMYNMVRIIIALMLKVGEGKFPPEHIKEILDGKSRKLAPYVAQPQGLYLNEVFYDSKYCGVKSIEQ